MCGIWVLLCRCPTRLKQLSVVPPIWGGKGVEWPNVDRNGASEAMVLGMVCCPDGNQLNADIGRDRWVSN